MPDQKVRLIAGKLKGRVLRFPDIEGLRPSPARLRETLFHWLRPSVLEGAVVLDAFAGSGALGFEALSAGADRVIMVERHPKAAGALRQSIDSFQVEDNVSLIQGNIRSILKKLKKHSIDIVFLDPPFAQHLHLKVLTDLIHHDILHLPAYLYLEYPAHEPLPDWSEALGPKQNRLSLSLLKKAQAGDVLGLLFHLQARSES